MTLIPFASGRGRRAPAGSEPTLRSVRLKEITALYQEVTIRCAVGRYFAEAPAIGTAEDVARLFGFLAFESKESFYALHLSAKNEILCLDQVSLGSLTASLVHPREVFKSALLSSAAALIFVHNHPSGDPTPSGEDHALQQRLEAAAELLGIRVLDHLIIGRHGRYLSLATAPQEAGDAGRRPQPEPPLFI